MRTIQGCRAQSHLTLRRFWWRDVRLSELGHIDPTAYYDEKRGFAHPVRLLPVPYHQGLTCTTIINTVIPLARSPRRVQITVPLNNARGASHDMDIDQATQESEMELNPDGILLYVAQASYESGTSPLSVWIPSRSLNDPHAGPSAVPALHPGSESPLDVFDR